jgi:hypothetical protein
MFHLLQWDHDKTMKKRKLISEVHDPKKNPCIELKIEGLLGSIEQPLYINRLVNHAIKLPDTNNDLFERCFIKFEVDLQKPVFQIKHQNPMKICEVEGLRGTLKKHYTLHLESLNSSFNSPQIQTIVSRKVKSQLFTVSLQLPKNLQDVCHAPLINAKILSGSLNFDPFDDESNFWFIILEPAPSQTSQT